MILPRTSGDAPAYWMQGILWTLLASGEETGGRYAPFEQLCPKGPLALPDEQRVAAPMRQVGLRRA